jgi:hypothetical protein
MSELIGKGVITLRISDEALEHMRLVERYVRLKPYLSRKGQKALRKKWGLK